MTQRSNSRVIGLRVPLDDYARVRALADARNVTVGRVGHDAMMIGLAELERKERP